MTEARGIFISQLSMYQLTSTSAVSQDWADGGTESNNARDAALCPALLCKPLVIGTYRYIPSRGCCQLLQFLSPRFRSPAQLRTQTLKATLKQSTESPKFPFGKQKNKIRCSANISHPITKVFFLSQTSHRPKPPSQRHLPRELQGFNRQITPGSAFSPLTSYLLNNLHLDNLLL